MFPKQYQGGAFMVWGRPVSALEVPDGSLLISEDGANKVWRISYGK